MHGNYQFVDINLIVIWLFYDGGACKVMLAPFL